MFKKRRPTNSGAPENHRGPSGCERIPSCLRDQPFNHLDFPARKQRVIDGAKVLLDIARESADWFPPLKSALGGVNALIKHYEVLVESTAVVYN